jgi:hypothetical protein
MSGRARINIKATQATASGVGTVMATVAGSYLGVTGTLIGAGLMSVLTTTGGAVVEYYLTRGSRRVRAVAKQKVKLARQPGQAGAPVSTGEATATVVLPADQTKVVGASDSARDSGSGDSDAGDERSPSEGTVQFGVPVVTDVPEETRVESAAAVPGGANAPDDANGSGGDPDGKTGEDAGEERGDGPNWRYVAVSTVVIFALVMGGVFLFEKATGKPLASTVRGEKGTGTSLTGGQVIPTQGPGPIPSTGPSESSGVSTPAPTPAPTTPRPTGPTGGPTGPPTGQPPVPPTGQPSVPPTESVSTPPAGDPNGTPLP